MHNTSQRPRPLHFNNKTDMHSFVYGNQSQAVSMSVPFAPIPKTYHSHSQTSLFDRYNRCNLYLRDCDERDLTILTKNIVMHQEPLSGQLAQNIARKTAQDKARSKKMQLQGSPMRVDRVDAMLRTAPQPVPSRQYTQNEVFFNYKEMGDMKRKQKQDYLASIEHIVQDAEHQISQLQNIQEEQKIEIGQIHKQQREIERQVNSDYRVGLMQQQIATIHPIQEAGDHELMHIHEQMEPNQINEILEEHHRLNDDILERANRAKSKEFKQSRGNFGMSMTQGQKLGKTLKKSMGPPKSITSTAKDGFKGKQNRKK